MSKIWQHCNANKPKLICGKGNWALAGLRNCRFGIMKSKIIAFATVFLSLFILISYWSSKSTIQTQDNMPGLLTLYFAKKSVVARRKTLFLSLKLERIGATKQMVNFTQSGKKSRRSVFCCRCKTVISKTSKIRDRQFVSWAEFIELVTKNISICISRFYRLASMTFRTGDKVEIVCC